LAHPSEPLASGGEARLGRRDSPQGAGWGFYCAYKQAVEDFKRTGDGSGLSPGAFWLWVRVDFGIQWRCRKE
jgi:hypothetical protein